MELEKMLKNAMFLVVLSSSAFLSSCSCAYCPSESVSTYKKPVKTNSIYMTRTDYYTIEDINKK